MKFFFLFLFLSTVSALAGSNQTSSKINTEVLKLSSVQTELETHTETQGLAAESFWKAIHKGYWFFKSLKRPEAEISDYLVSATEAFARNNLKDLYEWLHKQNLRFSKMNYMPVYNSRWKVISTEINESIGTMTEVRRESHRRINTFQSAIAGLNKIAIENQQAPVLAVPNLKKPSLKASAPAFPIEIFALAALLFASVTGNLFFALIWAKKKKTSTLPTKEQLSVSTVPSNIYKKFDAEVVHAGVSLEEKWRSTLETHDYLLNIADLKVHPSQRSPFNTRLNVPEDKVNEALQWLIKGTLAIANGSSQKATHIDWSCQERNGRVCLEVTLHGIECDAEKLYYNVLSDGSGSAPAHFGRTEMVLSDHLATVGIKSLKKKTIVNFAMDASPLSH